MPIEDFPYGKAFLEAIKKDRYDERSRKIFADWLEEKGFDDEAAVQRRWTKEIQQAEDWLRDLASKCGNTCINYGERYDAYSELRNQWIENGRVGPEPNYYDIPETAERWEPITYETLIEAGHAYINSREYFVQMGSETLRDMMYGETVELFWKNWELVTGVTVPNEVKEDAPFSCSC